MRLDVAAKSERFGVTRDQRRMLIAPVGLKLVARHLRPAPQAEHEFDHLRETTCRPASDACESAAGVGVEYRPTELLVLDSAGGRPYVRLDSGVAVLALVAHASVLLRFRNRVPGAPAWRCA